MVKIINVDDIKLLNIDILYTKKDTHRQHVTNCIIKKFGQFRPLLVYPGEADNYYYLIAGSAILNALKNHDQNFAFCWVFDSNISTSDVLTINMIDNQHRDLDTIRMAKTLESMLEAGEVNYKALANVLHHSRDEIHNFKELKDFNWEDFDNDPTHFQTSLF